jgi:hypothetical protein
MLTAVMLTLLTSTGLMLTTVMLTLLTSTGLMLTTVSLPCLRLLALCLRLLAYLADELSTVMLTLLTSTGMAHDGDACIADLPCRTHNGRILPLSNIWEAAWRHVRPMPRRTHCWLHCSQCHIRTQTFQLHKLPKRERMESGLWLMWVYLQRCYLWFGLACQFPSGLWRGGLLLVCTVPFSTKTNSALQVRC